MMMSANQRSSLCYSTDYNISYIFSTGLLNVQCHIMIIKAITGIQTIKSSCLMINGNITQQFYDRKPMRSVILHKNSRRTIKFKEISRISRRVFKFQEISRISRSCRHPVYAIPHCSKFLRVLIKLFSEFFYISIMLSLSECSGTIRKNFDMQSL